MIRLKYRPIIYKILVHMCWFLDLFYRPVYGQKVLFLELKIKNEIYLFNEKHVLVFVAQILKSIAEPLATSRGTLGSTEPWLRNSAIDPRINGPLIYAFRK
jgi:hypothetical protein